MELADIIVSGILGLAVVILTWRTIALSKQSMKQEKDMRILETNIALYDKRFELLRFLSEIIYSYSPEKYNSKVYNSMRFSATYLFPKPLGSKIMDLFDKLLSYYEEGKEPSEYLKKYANHELMENKNGKPRIVQAFYLEYMFIGIESSLIMTLANNYKIDFSNILDSKNLK